MFASNRLFAFILVLSVSAFHVVPAHGAECLGQQFPDSVKVGNSELILNGMGIRKATFLKVKVYVTGLYLPQKSSDGQSIVAANQPWRLVLRFVHDADASDIRSAFEDGFKKAAGNKLGAIRTRVDALKARMIDFKTGHFLSYTYDPSAGTIVDVNGVRGPALEGADFAAALLTISIGPEPPNRELKSGLLGGKCE